MQSVRQKERSVCYRGKSTLIVNCLHHLHTRIFLPQIAIGSDCGNAMTFRFTTLMNRRSIKKGDAITSLSFGNDPAGIADTRAAMRTSLGEAPMTFSAQAKRQSISAFEPPALRTPARLCLFTTLSK